MLRDKRGARNKGEEANGGNRMTLKKLDTFMSDRRRGMEMGKVNNAES